MNSFLTNLAKGKTVICKYPKHGRLNILKKHSGVVEDAGFGPNGPYAKIRCNDGLYRTLRLDRMIDPVCC
jgi:hypothetical protein